MYRIGELAKLADVTPDTIRYYEKQQMMEHEIRTEGGFRAALIPNIIPARNQKGSSRKDCRRSKHE